jgi:hypothetical protein
MSSNTSRHHYKGAPKVVQIRASSSDSRSSNDSKGSTEPGNYTLSQSSARGYYSGSQSMMETPLAGGASTQRYRAPDAGTSSLFSQPCSILTNSANYSDQKYVESKRRGNVEVIDQRRRIHDPEEPHSRDATSSDFRKERRDEIRHSSSRHSSHKHTSHRR